LLTKTISVGASQMKKFQIRALVVASIAALGGCATPSQVATQAVDMSLAIEEAHNRMLFLNVVRAYHRRPMHFFRVSSIKGPAGIGVFNPSIKIPLGKFFDPESYEATLSGKPDQPVFDVTPLDSQEFMRGITAPIDSKLLGYYFDQGWPKQLLLHLFVREVEITRPIMKDNKEDTETLVIENFPQNEKRFKAFQDFVASISEDDLEVGVSKTDPTDFGPVLNIDSGFRVDHLWSARASDLLLEIAKDKAGKEQKNMFQLKQKSPATLTLVSKAKQVHGDSLKTPTNEASKSEMAMLFEACKGIQLKNSDSTNASETPKNKTACKLTLRSPESSIYYLGEIARWQRDNPTRPIEIQMGSKRSTKKEKFFVMNQGDASTASLVTSFEGITYSIPRSNDAGRSHHVLSLLTQLIALQNKGTEIPVGSSLRISQ
jgi:hypothetical protein